MYFTKKMLAIGQLSIIVFALVLSFAPQFSLVAFIAYFIIIMYFSIMSQRRLGGVKASDVAAGRVLYRETNVMDIAVKDEKLNEELAAQMKMFGTSIALFIVVIGVYGVMGMFKDTITSVIMVSLGVSEHVALFLYWLLVFELIFVINRVLMFLAAGRSVQQQPPLMPASYIVTDRGIASTGALAGFAIGFPLPEEAEIRVEERRRFVEIVLRGRRIRLYTKNPRRLYELIQSLNERARRRTDRR